MERKLGTAAHHLPSTDDSYMMGRSEAETRRLIAQSRLYGFFSMIMFGAYYYILPRLTRNEWSSARLIKLHFWTAAIGIIAYFVALSWSGWFQGEMMNDPAVPFIKTVAYTRPYLLARSISGSFMTIANVTFAVLVWRILYRRMPNANDPTLLGSQITQQAVEVGQ